MSNNPKANKTTETEPATTASEEQVPATNEQTPEAVSLTIKTPMISTGPTIKNN